MTTEPVGAPEKDRQERILDAVLSLLSRPELSRRDCDKRAADVDAVQNGRWLTALLGLDRASLRRAVALCETIALAP